MFSDLDGKKPGCVVKTPCPFTPWHPAWAAPHLAEKVVEALADVRVSNGDRHDWLIVKGNKRGCDGVGGNNETRSARPSSDSSRQPHETHAIDTVLCPLTRGNTMSVPTTDTKAPTVEQERALAAMGLNWNDTEVRDDDVGTRFTPGLIKKHLFQGRSK